MENHVAIAAANQAVPVPQPELAACSYRALRAFPGSCVQESNRAQFCHDGYLPVGQRAGRLIPERQPARLSWSAQAVSVHSVHGCQRTHLFLSSRSPVLRVVYWSAVSCRKLYRVLRSRLGILSRLLAEKLATTGQAFRSLKSLRLLARVGLSGFPVWRNDSRKTRLPPQFTILQVRQSAPVTTGARGPLILRRASSSSSCIPRSAGSSSNISCVDQISLGGMKSVALVTAHGHSERLGSKRKWTFSGEGA